MFEPDSATFLYVYITNPENLYCISKQVQVNSCLEDIQSQIAYEQTHERPQPQIKDQERQNASVQQLAAELHQQELRKLKHQHKILRQQYHPMAANQVLYSVYMPSRYTSSLLGLKTYEYLGLQAHGLPPHIKMHTINTQGR